MVELRIECLNVAVEPYGAAPTLVFRLRVTAVGGVRVHAVALRCQIRIEPRRRHYADNEAQLLTAMFGDRSRWGDTLKPLQLSTESVLVPSFTGTTVVDVPVACSYDLEVASGQYLHALSDGIVPLLLLFSGTVFGKGENGFWIDQIPWQTEASYPMPARIWQELMERYFPDSGWIRLRRDTIDELLRYKSTHAIATWDALVGSLLATSGEGAS